MIATREDAIAQLIACADVINASDPREAHTLLRVADGLIRRGREQRSEYHVGQADGTEDRRTGHRISETILGKLYGLEYIRGYESGWRA